MIGGEIMEITVGLFWGYLWIAFIVGFAVGFILCSAIVAYLKKRKEKHPPLIELYRVRYIDKEEEENKQ